MRDTQDKRVFYFATGSGADVAALWEQGCNIVTMDFSRKMIQRTLDRLVQKNIPYLLKQGKYNQSEVKVESQRQVVIYNQDISQIEFTKDSFDYCFCYCTLPLLNANWEPTLEKLLTAAKNGAVSVYEQDELPALHAYYTSFGFKAGINDRTITLDGGFSYYAVPPEEMKRVIEKQRVLEIETVGLGNIYKWHESQ